MLVFRRCLLKYLRPNNATASTSSHVISVKHTASKQLWQNVRWGSTARVEGYSVVFQMVYMFNSFHITNLRVGTEKPHHGIGKVRSKRVTGQTRKFIEASASAELSHDCRAAHLFD